MVRKLWDILKDNFVRVAEDKSGCYLAWVTRYLTDHLDAIREVFEVWWFTKLFSNF
jgi:hypothetical protein